MQIRIVAVGKIKETYLREGIAEFTKRLSPFTKVEIVEVMEEKTPDRPSPAEIEKAKAKEASKLQAHLKPGGWLVVLDVAGRTFSSASFAAYLAEKMNMGQSECTFVIGGPWGIDASLLQQADLRLSLSTLTFTHQMTRLILLEQIYRAFKIMRGEPYHKCLL